MSLRKHKLDILNENVYSRQRETVDVNLTDNGADSDNPIYSGRVYYKNSNGYAKPGYDADRVMSIAVRGVENADVDPSEFYGDGYAEHATTATASISQISGTPLVSGKLIETTEYTGNNQVKNQAVRAADDGQFTTMTGGSLVPDSASYKVGDIEEEPTSRMGEDVLQINLREPRE